MGASMKNAFSSTKEGWKGLTDCAPICQPLMSTAACVVLLPTGSTLMAE